MHGASSAVSNFLFFNYALGGSCVLRFLKLFSRFGFIARCLKGSGAYGVGFGYYATLDEWIMLLNITAFTFQLCRRSVRHR
jgi:hypothetical protein